MRFLIELSRATTLKINELIEAGKYHSLHEFLLVATENQLFLESHALNSQSTLISEPKQEKKTNIPATNISSPFNLKNIGVSWSDEIKTIDPPKLEELYSKYIWGQYNRIFPIKITLRVLANSLGENEAVELANIQEKAANEAINMGSYLIKLDRNSNRKRWDAFSVALPKRKKNHGSISRFKLQFVGYCTKDRRLHGLPASLGFVNILKNNLGKGYLIGITEAGLKFAAIKNPIIDSDSDNHTLSDEEISYYISHVCSNQPYEFEAIKTVLETINSGQTTVDAIKKSISSLDKSWTSNVLTTMSSGILSRMRELKVIILQKEGMESYYELGPNSGMVKY